ncbi:hypothetical protein A2U01_0098252, partial [Trifolium medium]|nr:hypothetical protein [Trifolium medium]
MADSLARETKELSVKDPLSLSISEFVDLFDQFGDYSGRGYSPFEVQFVGFALRMRVWLLAVVG